MTHPNETSRRRLLQLTAIGVSTAFLAGCLDDDDTDEDAWEDVDTIYFEGDTNQGWIGVEPGVIDGEDNPTLGLYAGREYELTWENGDGVNHNFQILDADDTVLESTDHLAEQGETLTLTFEATDEMVEYRCEPHPTTMAGDIDILED